MIAMVMLKHSKAILEAKNLGSEPKPKN